MRQDAPSDVGRAFVLMIAVGKAAVAGAAVGLALVGAVDVASAGAADGWLTDLQHVEALQGAAVAGGLVGALLRLRAA